MVMHDDAHDQVLVAFGIWDVTFLVSVAFSIHLGMLRKYFLPAQPGQDALHMTGVL
jgi:hypothetical protein